MIGQGLAIRDWGLVEAALRLIVVTRQFLVAVTTTP
jgi:hypothetical protein